MAYSGRYSVKNKEKYEGDPTKVIFRSLWERQVFKWVDENKNIVKWSSEEVVVPYRCQTDNRIHRYFIDVKLIMSNGSTYLVEIKPKSQCKPPKQPSRKSKKYLKEVMTYVKNQSKWNAATDYAKDRGWQFEVWTEETIKGMGIKLITPLNK
tara:strand:- start:2068 stop:2523 length:456 start_codon:yes stop_codon:yes gene_type:complete